MLHLLVWLLEWGLNGFSQRNELGWVTDFCTRCTDVRPMRMRKLSQVSFGGEKVLGHVIICPTCGLRSAVDPESYGVPLPDEAATPEALLRYAPAALVQKITQLTRAIQGELEPEPRREAITMAMLSAESVFIKAPRSRWDAIQFAFVGLLLTAILGAIAIWGSLVIDRRGLAWGIVAVLATTAAGCGFFLTRPRREADRACRSFLPTLAAMQARREELSAVLESLRQARFKAGRFIRVDRLWHALQQFERANPNPVPVKR